MASLEIQKLTIGYGHSAVQTALNLCAEAGQLICLLGQNGCGKSTLLRTLAGLQPALSGDVFVKEIDHSTNSSKLVSDGSQQPSFYHQQPLSWGARSLFTMHEQDRSKLLSVVLTERISADRTTVHDVVAMGRYPYSSFLGGLQAEDEKIISEALHQTEMMHKRDCFFEELSDGEKQRTLIAKALAQQTPFILLDEPTAHLDLPNRIKTLLLLRHLAHTTGRTVLISTHELELALQLADILWLMTPHQGVEVGTPNVLTASGAFQRAFADPHFRFESDAEGRLRLAILSPQ